MFNLLLINNLILTNICIYSVNLAEVYSYLFSLLLFIFALIIRRVGQPSLKLRLINVPINLDFVPVTRNSIIG